MAERAACKVDVLFKQLAKILRADLERLKTTANPSITLPDKYKDAMVFEWTALGREWEIRVIERSDDIVILGYRSQTLCHITTRWDAEKYRCYVVIHSGGPEPIEFRYKHLWKVSRHILEPVFFPPPPKD